MGASTRTPVSPRIVSGAVRAVDAGVVLACAVLAYAAWLAGGRGAVEHYYPVVLVAILLQANIFHIAGLYRFESFTNLAYQIGRAAVAWSLVFLLLIAVAFLTKTSDQFSRGWTLIWFASGLACLTALRIALYLRIRRWIAEGRLTRNIAIVGAGEHGARLVHHLNALRGGDTRVVGIFDDRADRVPDVIEGYPLAGTIDTLLRFARAHRVDQIIVALPWSAEERLLEILQRLRELPVDVRLSPDMIGFRLAHASFGRLGAIPVIDVFRKPLSDWKLLSKDIEDRLLGAVIALFVLPLMLAIAALIKLDSPGPVFFRQKRYGFNNAEFEVWKFRTMRADAARDVSVPQATRDDPRITALGRFLRRSSLDELPQIFNVLRGDMSLVGPRPHAIPHNEHYARIIEEYAARHRVRPGITGWAQINGWRGETDTVEKMQKRVEHDIYYIDNWSVGFDLRILALTAFAVLRGDNAY